MNYSFLPLVVISLLHIAQAAPLTVCTEASPEGFDVVGYNSLTTTNASADVLMDRLIEFDATNNKIVAGIASTWQISQDGRQITFTLRPDVAFHTTAWFTPTRPLNADDVLFTFERMLLKTHPWHKKSTTGYPHAVSFGLVDLVKSIEKIDPHTIRFHLNNADATFLPTLTMGFASIYSAEYAEHLANDNQYEQLNQKPIGTGPFVLQSYSRDANIRYVAHPDYFRGKAASEQLVFSITPDTSVRMQKIQAGECAIALSPSPAQRVEALKNPKIKQLATPAFMTAFVALNTEHPPLNQPDVRRAIRLAFDQTHYIKAVFQDTAIAASSVYPPNTWSAKTYPAPSDPIAQAKTLLKQIDFKQDKPIHIFISSSGSQLNPNPKLGAELLQADLKNIGIEANIINLEWGELIKRAKAGEHDLLFMGWAGDNGDPDNFITPQFACAALKTGINFARYCEPSMDQWISDAKQNTNQEQRSVLYEKIQDRINEQTLWIPLAHPQAWVLVRDIEGYSVNPFGRQDFFKTRITP